MTDGDRDGPPWGPERRTWQGRGRWGGGRRPRPRHVAGFVGCLFVALALLIAGLTALATLIAGALLGLVAPGSAPSAATSIAVVGAIVLGLLVTGRLAGGAFRPLADLADATGRLADGETGVRIRPRGPRPVRDLAASFNAMAERLDRSRADRQALLADVTHELRTPLTVISGGIEAMLDGVHPADEDHLAPILAQARVMDRLLDDLRTMSLAGAGALPLHREPVDLRALAQDVVSAHAAVASAAGVALSAEGDGPVETSVDPVRVQEILGNLVANALRHTPAGGSVTVSVGRDATDALLSVRDTGEGIPPGDLARIFDRFQRRRSDSGGSGLGLTIARDLAAAHGGSIEAQSDGVPGRGSTFRVRLPLRDR